ncbi:hypothetical protein NE865_10237 [Phthorimaea operculella]|nr:hypothetical protein NE865_10237 [Phthorimaea operculella]
MLLYIFPFIILQTNYVLTNVLDVETNIRKKLERSNIVNKGVWVRNVKDADAATNTNFLFRGNAIDTDNIVQGDFNAFSDPNLLYIANYVERSKRSPAYGISRFPRKTVRTANSLNNDNAKDKSASVKSNVLPNLKPTLIFNDYPYEIVPILLANDKRDLVEAKNYSTYVVNEANKNESANITIVPLNETHKNEKVNKTYVPKRSMNDFENKDEKKIENLGDNDNKKCFNNTQENNNRPIFGLTGEETSIMQAAPIPNHDVYKTRVKSEDNQVGRPISERGLIKVLSMLTNAFKKVMKQHSSIKEINRRLTLMNEDFVKNLEIVSDKFQDFDAKYTNIEALHQKILESVEKFNAKELHCKIREKQLARNIVEFELQQKKFLAQQKQFYNVQRLLLAQNEKINSKQNTIARTQSEISHRQNNFARILKKAKQIYSNSKSVNTAAYPKFESNPYHEFDESDPQHRASKDYTSTTKRPESTESIKINLFSVPPPTRLQNQDHLILNEKDEQPVDDLVYKYYFNNTFIESLMRNFLSNFVSIGEQKNRARNTKTKRDEATEKTTLLLPVNKADNVNVKPVTRERRWINHHSRRKWRHKNKGKSVDNISKVDDEKTVKDNKKPINNLLDGSPLKTLPNEGKPLELTKSDPFLTMAISFCNGIGQNQTPQVLRWCVEKALRRLQNIDIKMPPPPAPDTKINEINVFKPARKNPDMSTVTEETASTTQSPLQSPSPTASTLVPGPSPPPAHVMYTPVSTIVAKTTQNLNLFFPDNEQLETNLKEFDLKPDADTEGNVYYEGSLHASDMIKAQLTTLLPPNGTGSPAHRRNTARLFGAGLRRDGGREPGGPFHGLPPLLGSSAANTYCEDVARGGPLGGRPHPPHARQPTEEDGAKPQLGFGAQPRSKNTFNANPTQ